MKLCYQLESSNLARAAMIPSESLAPPGNLSSSAVASAFELLLPDVPTSHLKKTHDGMEGLASHDFDD